MEWRCERWGWGGKEKGREGKRDRERVRGERLGWADFWVGWVSSLWLGQFSRGRCRMAPSVSHEGGVPVIMNFYKHQKRDMLI